MADENKQLPMQVYCLRKAQPMLRARRMKNKSITPPAKKQSQRHLPKRRNTPANANGISNAKYSAADSESKAWNLAGNAEVHRRG